MIPERHNSDKGDRGVGGRRWRAAVRGLGAHGLARERQRDGPVRLLELRAVPRREQQPALQILPQVLPGTYTLVFFGNTLSR